MTTVSFQGGDKDGSWAGNPRDFICHFLRVDVHIVSKGRRRLWFIIKEVNKWMRF